MIISKIYFKLLKAVDRVIWTDLAIKTHNKRIGFHTSNYLFKEDQIAFIHIPKPGGTSLHKILRQDSLKRFINLNMHRPVSHLCSPTKFKYITVIRNPVDRVWSYYQMVLRNPPGSPYKRFVNRGLKYFLKHCWEVRNMSCRYYAGMVRKEPDKETLNRALDNPVNFYYVILFDNFTREIHDFLKKMTLPMVEVPHERKSNYNLPDENDIRIISQYNSLDIKLFKEWSEKNKKSWLYKKRPFCFD